MKSNSFDYFIKNEDSNSILLSFVHRWNSEVCILTSILWTDKILWIVSHTSPSLYSHFMEILLSSMFHISWLKYVLIASLTRTDFKHCYGETSHRSQNSWIFYCKKSSFMDKTFYPHQFIVPLMIVRLQVFWRVYQDIILNHSYGNYLGLYWHLANSGVRAHHRFLDSHRYTIV
jgi:hypothetical protein